MIEQVQELIDEIREAKRWALHWETLFPPVLVKLTALASALQKSGDLEASRIDRLSDNIRVGLHHLPVQRDTLNAYATGAISELTWLAGQLRKAQEAA